MTNQSTLSIEKGYPARVPVPDPLTSWGREYPGYLPNVFPDAPRTLDLLERKGLVIRTYKELGILGELSNRQAVDTYGDAVLNVRNPLGRTGINGTGIYYKAGKSTTADIAIMRATNEPQIILVYNRGKWSLPGGFKEPGDTDGLSIALREGQEETGLPLEDLDIRTLIKSHTKGNSRRSTDLAYLSNTVATVTLPDPTLGEQLLAGEDAEDAKWFTATALAELVTQKQISVDHTSYAQQAFSNFVRVQA